MRKVLVWCLILAIVCSLGSVTSLAQETDWSLYGDAIWDEFFDEAASLANWQTSGTTLSLEDEALKMPFLPES